MFAHFPQPDLGVYTGRIISLLFSDKATSPSNRQEDWESIMGFCDRVNKELEGYGHIVLIKPISHAMPNQKYLMLLMCLLIKHIELIVKSVITQTLNCLFFS